MTRNAHIALFLNAAGWGDAVRIAVPGDASTRCYERLELNGRAAVLMDAPKAAEAPSEPEGASIEERRALGYNALARIAGANSQGFTAIAIELRRRGFSAPQIIASDHDLGLILLEDLGNDLFARVIAKAPEKETELYTAAIETLAAIYRSSFPQVFDAHGTPWQVRSYDSAALLAEADLFLDWFAPDLGAQISMDAKTEWYAIWKDLFSLLSVHAPGLALRDFHAENLFWVPERQGTARVGLIDFQDGLFAHPAYDLVSLLEDARRDVTEGLRQDMISLFCEKSGLAFDEAFKAAYAVMGAQRNAKILGIFVRLAQRDGKVQYRDLIPRVVKLFLSDLSHPALVKLRDWVQKNVPQIFEVSHKIETAMVLAAGHGTRMRPLTDDRSKAMIEVNGKTLIDHMLDRLAEVGVRRAVVNVHAHAEQLEAHLKARTGLPEIIISDERAALLETGGGVVKALPLLGDGPIFICNIDAVWVEDADVVLRNMLKVWDPSAMDDLLLLAAKDATLGYHGPGDFELGPRGRLIRRKDETAEYVYAGVQIARIEPMRAFKAVPFTRKLVWEASLAKGRAFGTILEGFWMHVGDPQARDAAEARLANGSRA